MTIQDCERVNSNRARGQTMGLAMRFVFDHGTLVLTAPRMAALDAIAALLWDSRIEA